MWAEARARHHGAGLTGTVRKESTQTAPATSPHKSKKQRKMNAYACAVQACSNSALLSGLGSGSFTRSVTGFYRYQWEFGADS